MATGYIFIQTDTNTINFDIIPFGPANASIRAAQIGDLNNDGIINIIDVIDILNIILANGGYDSIADLNQDGIIDTIDVINVMNLILGGN